MRLYSRFYVVFIALLMAAVGFGAGVVAMRLFEPGQEPPRDTFSPEEVRREQEVLPVRSLDDYSEEERATISVYESRNEAVVNITTQVLAYNWFWDPVPQDGASGSGSIIDERGYVLTNNHVIEDAFQIYITLADGTRFEGELIGTDVENDLAVLKFDPNGTPLTVIPMGSSNDLRVGQKVLAIGNPFALERTLTTGIVSGLGRPVRTRSGLVIQDMIQTDASINPGNSGGPLLDAQGNMIGINTQIISTSGGSIGIGFAVPVDTASRVVPDLIEFGMVRRGWLDITPVELFPQLVAYADLPVDRGVLISRVQPGGAADDAGLRGGDRNRPVTINRSVVYLGGDIIVDLDGQRVTSIADMRQALEDNRPGQTVPVTVVRGREEVDLEVELVSRDAAR